MGECIGAQKTPKAFSVEELYGKASCEGWVVSSLADCLKAATDALGKDRDRNHRTNEAQHNYKPPCQVSFHISSLVKVSLWAQSQSQLGFRRVWQCRFLIDGLWRGIGRGPLSIYARPDWSACPHGVRAKGGIVEHAPLSNCLAFSFRWHSCLP